MYWDCSFLKSTRKKMKKYNRDILYRLMEEEIIPIMDDDDKKKIEFVKTYLKENFQVDDFENSYVNIKKLDSKSLLYVLFILIKEYEDTNQNSKKYLKYDSLKDETPYVRELFEEKMGKIRRIEKDTCFVEVKVEDIFPIGEFTKEEVKVIENCLDKLHIDIECNSDFLMSTNQLLCFMTGIIREYDIFKKKLQ